MNRGQGSKLLGLFIYCNAQVFVSISHSMKLIQFPVINSVCCWQWGLITPYGNCHDRYGTDWNGVEVEEYSAVHSGFWNLYTSDNTSYRQISWSLEAKWLGFVIIASFFNLTGPSAALLQRQLPNSTAIASLYSHFLWLWNFSDNTHLQTNTPWLIYLFMRNCYHVIICSTHNYVLITFGRHM